MSILYLHQKSVIAYIAIVATPSLIIYVAGEWQNHRQGISVVDNTVVLILIGDHFQIGKVEVNLAEFAGGGSVQQFYLLHAASNTKHLDNSIVKARAVESVPHTCAM